MSDASQRDHGAHAPDVPSGTHPAHVGAEHGEVAGHEETHGDPGGVPEHADHHEEQPLGPIDLPAWGASILGFAAGVAICWLLFLAIT
jgi:hypothetical protein